MWAWKSRAVPADRGYGYRDYGYRAPPVSRVLLGRYAVFGLGSSMYPQFCAFAHDIDQKLSHLGASQLVPTGEGDELSGQEDAFRDWAVQTFRVSS